MKTYRSPQDEHLLSVQEICMAENITRKTLFYYDRIGLLKPARREGVQKHKYYSHKDLIRLRKIRRLLSAGLRLKEVRLILDDPNTDRIAVYRNVRKRLEESMTDLSEQIERIEELIREENK